MKTILIAVRLDQNLRKLLRAGARRTSQKEQDLIRLTLCRHLRGVIEEEALVKATPRVTNVEPWPKRVVEAAYRRMGKDWEALENAATRAQGRLDFNG